MLNNFSNDNELIAPWTAASAASQFSPMEFDSEEPNLKTIKILLNNNLASNASFLGLKKYTKKCENVAPTVVKKKKYKQTIFSEKPSKVPPQRVCHMPSMLLNRDLERDIQDNLRNQQMGEAISAANAIIEKMELRTVMVVKKVKDIPFPSWSLPKKTTKPKNNIEEPLEPLEIKNVKPLLKSDKKEAKWSPVSPQTNCQPQINKAKKTTKPKRTGPMLSLEPSIILKEAEYPVLSNQVKAAIVNLQRSWKVERKEDQEHIMQKAVKDSEGSCRIK